jgi:hypothetical protein
LENLIATRTIQPIDVNAATLLPQPERNLSMRDFLQNERDYTSKLESLLDYAEKCTNSKDRMPDTLRYVFATLPALVAMQRCFLLRLEILVAWPSPKYSVQTVFKYLAQNATAYAGMIALGDQTTWIIGPELIERSVQLLNGGVCSLLELLQMPREHLMHYSLFLEACYFDSYGYP